MTVLTVDVGRSREPHLHRAVLASLPDHFRVVDDGDRADVLVVDGERSVEPPTGATIVTEPGGDQTGEGLYVPHVCVAERVGPISLEDVALVQATAISSTPVRAAIHLRATTEALLGTPLEVAWVSGRESLLRAGTVPVHITAQLSRTFVRWDIDVVSPNEHVRLSFGPWQAPAATATLTRSKSEGQLVSQLGFESPHRMFWSGLHERISAER